MNHQDNLNIILEFLENNPMFYPGTDDDEKRYDFFSEDMKQNIIKKYHKEVERIGIYQPKPNVQPWDPVWSLIIQHKFPDIELPDASQMAYIKSYQKAAEQIGGNILEYYINSIIQKDYWVWAIGAVVSHTDFIKKEEDGSWSLLQIKSRYNTENAASKNSRISLARDTGQEILHWYRFKINGQTNWEEFPLESSNLKLSEEDFQDFIIRNLHI